MCNLARVLLLLFLESRRPAFALLPLAALDQLMTVSESLICLVSS